MTPPDHEDVEPTGEEPRDTAGTSLPERRAIVRVSRRHLWIIGIVGGVLVLLGVWLVTAQLPALLHTASDGVTEPPGAAAAPEERRIQATLYYVSADGRALTAVRGTALYGPTPAEQAKHIVEAQVQEPPDGQRSAIPTGTTVRTVFLARDGRAFVDLGGSIRSGHTGGSLDEALAVYAIVNALAVNLPNITAVQILIDGQQVDTLVGHLDLRYPLSRALEWVRKGQ